MDRTREIIDRFIAWSPVLLLGALAALTYWLDAQVQLGTATVRSHPTLPPAPGVLPLAAVLTRRRMPPL